MAATSFGDVPLPPNNRMSGEPLDGERILQAVRQDERTPREATMRKSRPASTAAGRLRDDRVVLVKVELIDRRLLNELVATVQVVLPESR